MKFVLISLNLVGTSFALSESRPSFPYENEVVKAQDIDLALPYHNDTQGFPDSLQGIWWLHGAPGGGVVSLANSIWDKDNKCLEVKISAPNTYSYSNTPESDIEAMEYREMNAKYDVCLNESFDEAVLNMSYELELYGQRITINIPKFLLNFSMSYLKDKGYWLRTSKVLGLPLHTYKLTRIVNYLGDREESYEAFIDEHSDERMVIIREN